MGTVLILGNWNYQEFMEFNIAHQKGQARKAFELASKVVTDWDYDVDLNSENPVMKLNPTQSARIMRQIVESIEVFTQSIETDEVAVDLNVWSTEKFLDFNEAQMNRDFKTVERMLHEIASLDGVSPDEPLTATQGMKMQFAVTQHYRKVIEGKN